MSQSVDMIPALAVTSKLINSSWHTTSAETMLQVWAKPVKLRPTNTQNRSKWRNMIQNRLQYEYKVA
jgi:hypothetical protein